MPNVFWNWAQEWEMRVAVPVLAALLAGVIGFCVGWKSVADRKHVVAAPFSNCYVPGEAHNELTLPCVTIEP